LSRDKLVWLIPISIASVVFVMICLDHTAFMKNGAFFPVAIIYGFVAPVGGFWATRAFVTKSILGKQQHLGHGLVGWCLRGVATRGLFAYHASKGKKGGSSRS
jgi:hypothetical protein